MFLKNHKKNILFVILLSCFFVLLFSGVVFAQDSAQTGPGAFALSKFFGPVAGFCDYWGKIFNFSVGIAGILAVAAISLGGLYYLVSFGSKDKTGSAKAIITGAIAGFLLMLLGWTVFYTLSPRLTQCKLEIAWLELAGEDVKDTEMVFPGEKEAIENQCAGVSEGKLFNNKGDCESKGGENGGKCDGSCLEGQTKTEGAAKETPTTIKKWCCKKVGKAGGRVIKTIYVHWSAGPINRIGGSYHYAVTGDGVVHARFPDEQIQSCTWKRNKEGLCTSGMGAMGFSRQCYQKGGILGEGCGGSGVFTNEQLSALKGITSQKAAQYGANVMTHSQAAKIDNYHCYDTPLSQWNPDRPAGSCRWDWDNYSF